MPFSIPRGKLQYHTVDFPKAATGCRAGLPDGTLAGRTARDWRDCAFQAEWLFHGDGVADVARDSSLLQTETFGPVLAVTAFDYPKMAVDLANGTDQGLAAGAFTPASENADFLHY
ncbi:aldehyde dehydrogenase family protein [Mesorhizobium sp.]|uniref:aldehyde dehydrogenase family protein n=1 Tax=Mesorhizobium sp. TaxID=1871066 RepID=UPI0025832EA6|nr:aldehyde dehydrogenase family protein [Mesorhizobium sp.]